MIIFIITLVVDWSIFVFLLLTFLTESIELEDVSGNLKPFFGSFLFVGISHGADVNAFGTAAFGADQMMMVMRIIGQFVDVAGAAENFVNDVKLRQQGKIAVDGVKGYIGLLFAYLFTDLLCCRKRRTACKGL